MTKDTKETKEIITYKGFDDDWKCRGFLFEVGKTYKHDGPVKACDSGFHVCLNPWDVLSYYDITTPKAECTVAGEIADHHDDSKLAAAEISIKAELKLPEFVTRLVKWLQDETELKDDNASSGDYAQNASSGDYAKNASSGNNTQNASSGYNAKNASSGNRAKNACYGKHSVIASAGVNGIAKGVIGTWISLAEFDGNYKCIGFATGCIGQDGLKPDTWYRAEGGKLVQSG